MTGDDGMEVLDLDMELDEHALRVFQLHSQPWLKARLQFYKEKSDALWRRRRNGSRHRNRVSQVVAEILLRQVGKDLDDMELSSEAHEQVMTDHDEENNEDCWISSMNFISLYLRDLQTISEWALPRRTGHTVFPAGIRAAPFPAYAWLPPAHLLLEPVNGSRTR